MRHRTHNVFDDYVSSTGTMPTTDARYNALLGEHDALALHAICDNATASTTVNIHVQHSSEGRQWLYRQNNSTNPGTPELSFVLTLATDVKHLMWSDACLGTTTSGPLLSFVRIAFLVTGGSAHVKLHATQRGGSAH